MGVDKYPLREDVDATIDPPAPCLTSHSGLMIYLYGQRRRLRYEQDFCHSHHTRPVHFPPRDLVTREYGLQEETDQTAYDISAGDIQSCGFSTKCSWL